MRKKLGALTDHVFDAFPSEFTTFLSYTRALGFDEQPDYVYIRTLFRDLLKREGYQYDFVFDWCVEATDQKDNGTATDTRRRESKENNRPLASDRVYVPFLSIDLDDLINGCPLLDSAPTLVVNVRHLKLPRVLLVRSEHVKTCIHALVPTPHYHQLRRDVL
jgi:hypothetical protein